jgi:hypothetical protein
MTLVITELSEAGIAMVADSAISYRNRHGRIIQRPETWEKLLRVPSVGAAISYWGDIGTVTSRRFDDWLRELIKKPAYDDLPSLAEHIAAAMNNACGGQPLPQNYCVGVHVAGYHSWPDGGRRPVFFHVHNGHGSFKINQTIEKINGKRCVIVTVDWEGEPRRLFAKHQDFPDVSRPLAENLAKLRKGYITRNGDYFIYAIFAQKLNEAFSFLNLVSELSIPRDPISLSSRLGLLKTILNIMISIYGCTTKGRTIGRPVMAVGIKQDRKYITLSKNNNSQ